MSDTKIFISQKEAKRQFRHAGFSIIAAAAEVEKLKKYADGKREKVKSIDVRRVIREAAEPSPLPLSAKPIRPCIPRHLRAPGKLSRAQ